MIEAQWTNGKTTVKGMYSYYWPSNTFTIEIDRPDSLTGEKTRVFQIKGDEPEWGKYRLVRSNSINQSSTDASQP